MSGHPYRLDPTQRADGIVSSGGAHELRARLAAGLPLSVVSVGASVAVQGGCIDQPGDECMSYSGEAMPTGRVGTKPSARPSIQPTHMGFLVRFMRWLNISHPHRDHSLLNLARGGTALQTLLPCLFGTLPTRVDLVVVEVGSMAKFLVLSSIELAVRKFLALRPSPAILFVTAPSWYAQAV